MVLDQQIVLRYQYSNIIIIIYYNNNNNTILINRYNLSRINSIGNYSIFAITRLFNIAFGRT